MKNLLHFLLISLNVLLSATIFAGSAKIEQWKNGEELRFTLRNDKGLFVSHGVLNLESWNDGDNVSEWVARRANGTFVSGGYKGRVEKFKVSDYGREQMRLVIRNSKGQFVTWVSMEEYLSAKWEVWTVPGTNKKEARYVIRDYKGMLVNHAKASLENWANYSHPVLVARDSEDDGNNGKILSWIAPSTTARGKLLGYQNPNNFKRFLPFKNQ